MSDLISSSEIPNSSDCISRQDAKDAIDMALDHIDHVPPWVYDKLLNALNEVPSAEKAQLSEEDATSDLIRRVEATTIPVMPKEHREYQTMNLDDAYEQGWFDCQKCIEELPSAEPKTPSNGSITCVKSEKMHDRTMGDLISRQDVLHELEGCDYELKDWQRWKLKTMVRDIPSAEPERLTDDDFETIRIHLNAQKEKLCNQRRWEEAEEYQRIIDRFMVFASAQPDLQPTCNQLATDTISRQDAIRWIKAECNPYGKPTLDYETSCRIMEHLDRMPSAEPERNTGEWITDAYGNIMCSECGWNAPRIMTGSLANRHLGYEKSEFCWHCGAYMRGEQE